MYIIAYILQIVKRIKEKSGSQKKELVSEDERLRKAGFTATRRELMVARFDRFDRYLASIAFRVLSSFSCRPALQAAE